MSDYVPRTIWLTGLSGSGKTTLAKEADVMLRKMKVPSIVLDGDDLRAGLNRDLDFSVEGRLENVRRVSEVAKLINDAGINVLAALVSPRNSHRDMAKSILGTPRYIEVYVSTALAVCESRDPKGLYGKARKGLVHHFTGITDVYETPASPHVTIDTAVTDAASGVRRILRIAFPEWRHRLPD